MKQRITWAMCLSGAALLSACGGGDDEEVVVAPVTQIPASAGASSLAYTQYAGTLVATENTEPLGTDAVATAPVSETDEPVAVN